MGKNSFWLAGLASQWEVLAPQWVGLRPPRTSLGCGPTESCNIHRLGQNEFISIDRFPYMNFNSVKIVEIIVCCVNIVVYILKSTHTHILCKFLAFVFLLPWLVIIALVIFSLIEHLSKQQFMPVKYYSKLNDQGVICKYNIMCFCCTLVVISYTYSCDQWHLS